MKKVLSIAAIVAMSMIAFSCGNNNAAEETVAEEPCAACADSTCCGACADSTCTCACADSAAAEVPVAE